MAVTGIYKITSPSNRVYIGQSIDIKARFSRYKSAKCHKQIRLYYSFQKYGVSKHKFEIICECKIDDLNKKERFYQDKYEVIGKQGLNVRLTGTNDKSGKLSEETKRRMLIAITGKKRTQEQKERISKGRRGVFAHGKLVLNTETGIFYRSVIKAAFSSDIKYGTLRAYLNSQCPNKTTFINV